MRRFLMVVVFCLLLVSLGACSPVGNQTQSSSPRADLDQNSPETSSPSDENQTRAEIPLALPPIDQVDQVAAILYQELSEGRDVAGLVEAVYQALGIPVLDPETEMDQIESAIENQAPFTTGSHVVLISDALASGMFINLGSFITEINRQGFYDLISGGDVTLDYLSENIAYLKDQDELSPGEVQIALVLALGSARAGTLYPELQDPVWGDGLLDPLQSSLLWHLLDQVAAFPQMDHSQGSTHLGALPNPQTHNLLGDLVGSLGETSAHLSEFCSCALLFGHQSQLTLSENQVYRQTQGSNKPFASEAAFSLKFSYQPSTPEDKLSARLGCPDLPSKGPRADRPVTWELIDSGARGASLQSLGEFTPGGPTNGQGISTANYLANLEVVPPYLQQKENLDAASGLVKATADLYPGNEYLLEALIKYAGKPEVEGVNLSQADLWVWYYTFPSVEWHLKEGPLNMEGFAFSCDGVNWVATHAYSLNAAGAQFFTSADFELTVPEIQLGDDVRSDIAEVTFEGTYTYPGEDPLAISDTRKVWLSFTEKSTTVNFETISATVTDDGQAIPIPFAFHTGEVPANLMPNDSCDGE